MIDMYIAARQSQSYSALILLAFIYLTLISTECCGKLSANKPYQYTAAQMSYKELC